MNGQFIQILTQVIIVAAAVRIPASIMTQIMTQQAEPKWAALAWIELCRFAKSKNINLKQSELEDLSVVKHDALVRYKKVMGGYYLIALGKAPSYVVDTVYSTIKSGLLSAVREIEETQKMPLDEFVRLLRREEGIPEYRKIYEAPVGEGFLAACERVLWALSFMKDRSRIDKVIAIDSVIQMVHDEGSFLVIVIGQGIRGGKLEDITPDVLGCLAEAYSQ